MKYFLVLYLCFVRILLSNSTAFDDENPVLFHHVNVMTGQLNLTFQDTVVEGALPLHINRSYTSAGALESKRHNDWILGGGWTLFPHTQMVFVRNSMNKHKNKRIQIYLPEKDGSTIKYIVEEETGNHIYLLPETKTAKASGSLGARHDPYKNRISVNRNTRKATVSAADGSIRIYTGHFVDRAYNDWHLDYEILPSKHRIVYNYEKGHLKDAFLQNPSGTKNLASAHFDRVGDNVTVDTSDGKSITYKLMRFKDRCYLEEVTSNCRPHERFTYQLGRKDIGGRVESMSKGPNLQFSATYYLPEGKDEEKKWAKKIPKKNYSADKVHLLKAHVGPEGALVTFAVFTYFEDHTDVRDSEGCLIRYHYTEEKLDSIEYFDNKDKLHSTLKFTWSNGHLKSKALCDPSEKTLFEKSFSYWPDGNVKREKFCGQMSNETLHAKDKHTFPPEYNELVHKGFKYENNLPIEEKEDNGLAYHFKYHEGTDLVKEKFTLKHAQILLREFYFYDTDNLLIRESIDNGKSPKDDDLTGVTERHNKYYNRDPTTGLCLSIAETFLELNTREDHQLSRRVFTYNAKNQIETETLYDCENTKQYTLRTTYDEHGHIIRKTTPSGLENLYTYDLNTGNLNYSKEVGQLHKHFKYDLAGRPIQCTETDGNSYTKVTHTTYDAKGRPRTQTDPRGNTTTQTYDTFGNCKAIHFPDALDEDHQRYTPVATLTHDIHGNITSHRDPLGHTTTTTYNIFRKPLSIRYPDGSTIQHHYNLNGTLAKTIHPDLTEDRFTYDTLHRIASKTTLAPDQKILSKEEWTYNAFHPITYTNAEGLKTIYSYDKAGRKIQEQAEDRITTYSYDTLSRLQKTTNTIGHSQVIHYNTEGLISSKWEEDTNGTIENKMTFFYDRENRKEKAIRLTSQGEATDTFRHDPEGRLTKHTDPKGAITQFLYTEERNSLGQLILVKTTIDPQGNITIETYDALSRLVQNKQQSPSHQTVAKEDLLYDRAGNKAARRTTIYHHTSPTKTYTVQWQTDSRGRVLKEIEEEEKITSYTYDLKGRLKTKTSPNGTILTYTFDRLDRLLTCHSSDKTLHYQYTYLQGASPITAQDKTRNLTWTRAYNLFGELTSETSPNGAKLIWYYDNVGRCNLFTLPDRSTITYTHNALHLTTVTRTSPAHSYTHAYTAFDPNGHVTQEELIHNLGTLATTHDLLERPSSQSSSWNQSAITYNTSGLVISTESTLTSDKTYSYDPLNQLLQEGSQTYDFDSLGNPTTSQTNHLNQIISIAGTQLDYDTNGNPFKRTTPTQTTQYTYDPLNRLTHINTNQYLYDPFGRLYAKQTPITTHYYLYDNDKEIGLLDQNLTILQLKVLGLGLSGDIGAAIAIELNNQVYAPLHDFAGNIIALISPDGTILESYDITAFGQETTTSSPLNPWRFNSKRTDEGLIFFGLRFYDPALGRWLTPDPAGSIDSPNLYLYVRNSPLNRLDLFGLYSTDQMDRIVNEFRTDITAQIWVKTNDIRNYTQFGGFIPAKVIAGDIKEDWVIASNLVYKLNFTPEERSKGMVNIVAHFPEMFPKEGQTIAIVGVQNGINNTKDEFDEMFAEVCGKIPGTPLIIGMRNPTNGFFNDLGEARQQMKNKETPDVILKRQILVTICDSLHKINPALLHVQIDHSGAGGITSSAYNGMTPEQKNLLQQHLFFIGVAPSVPIPRRYAFGAVNFYSEKDAITGTYGKKRQRDEDYNIQFLKCIPDRETNRYHHRFLCPTLQGGLEVRIDLLEGRYGFYNEKR